MIDEMMNERISSAENKRSCDEFTQESQKQKRDDSQQTAAVNQFNATARPQSQWKKRGGNQTLSTYSFFDLCSVHQSRTLFSLHLLIYTIHLHNVH